MTIGETIVMKYCIHDKKVFGPIVYKVDINGLIKAIDEVATQAHKKCCKNKNQTKKN